MSQEIDTRKVWLVPHPTSQFKEDVKALARQNNLRIIDAKLTNEIDSNAVTTKAPKLTNINEPKREIKVSKKDDSE